MDLVREVETWISHVDHVLQPVSLLVVAAFIVVVIGLFRFFSSD